MDTQPSTKGISTTPAAVAVMPLTDCRNSGTNEIAPNMAIPARKPVTVAASTMRTRNNRKGRIGSAARPSGGHPADRRGQPRADPKQPEGGVGPAGPPFDGDERREGGDGQAERAQDV